MVIIIMINYNEHIDIINKGNTIMILIIMTCDRKGLVMVMFR
jgi:hypothetical protein